jgi:hypothetical protein
MYPYCTVLYCTCPRQGKSVLAHISCPRTVHAVRPWPNRTPHQRSYRIFHCVRVRFLAPCGRISSPTARLSFRMNKSPNAVIYSSTLLEGGSMSLRLHRCPMTVPWARRFRSDHVHASGLAGWGFLCVYPAAVRHPVATTTASLPFPSRCPCLVLIMT